MFIVLFCIEVGLLAALCYAAVAGLFTHAFLLLAVVAADLLLLYFCQKRRKKRRREQGLNPPLPHVDDTFDMTGAEFERYVAEVYRRLGRRAVVTCGSGDQGIDIVVGRVFKVGVQTKCYHRPVGNKAVQEAAAGRRYYRCWRAAVVTNSIFSDAAVKLAWRNRVKLIDRRELAKMVRRANKQAGQS